MTDVKFPAMRQEVKTALAALADETYQQRVWIERQFPHDSFFDDLTMNVNILYDMVLFDPRSRLGVVLKNESEVDALLVLEQILDPLIADLRDASDEVYMTDPR